VRPADWFLVDLAIDPTPGDAFGIRALAAKYSDIATIADDSSDGVRRARDSGAASAWVGDAGDIFRDKSHRMPGELTKAGTSYSTVAEALRRWAESVDDTQAQADRGLQQAREAHADLLSAEGALANATVSWTTVHAQQLIYQKLQKDYRDVPPPADVTMPTDYQLRGADRGAQSAQQSMAAAQQRIGEANARLAAAKALVHSAKTRRDDAEALAVRSIGDAIGQAVKPSSFWEALQSSAGWQAFVQIATVVLTIVSIVAIFIGGPLVWAIILAATIVLIADALMQASEGKDMRLTIVLLLVGLIPGGRGITSLGRLAGAFRAGGGVLKGGALVLKELAIVAPKNAIVGTIRSLQQARVGLIPGVVSMIRSIPSIVGDARHTPIGFIGDVVSNLKSDYNLAVTGAWRSHIAAVGSVDPVGAAKLSQGGSIYSGVDDFDVGLVSPGDHIHVGAGGAMGGFASDPVVLGHAQALGDPNAVVHDMWGQVQVARSDDYGLRSGLFDFQPTTDFLTADGIAAANPHLGPGGGYQRFIPDIDAKLWNGDVVAYSVGTGTALKVTAEPIYNHAHDVVDVYAAITHTPADVFGLTGNAKTGLPGALTNDQATILTTPVRMGIHVAVTGPEIYEIHQPHPKQ
jgi:cellobiose-specific phosphotransferase system component IIA